MGRTNYMKTTKEVIEEISTKRVKGYFFNLFMVFSHLIAALIGTDRRIPFSSQCGYWYLKGKWRGRFFVPIIDYCFWLFNKGEIDHCVESWKHTERRIRVLTRYGARDRITKFEKK